VISKTTLHGHISKINHRINISANKYFDALGSHFVTLPLITRMISSPGAVYGREKINYTTDTCPIKLSWFDLSKEAFLAESSQIYLELALMQKLGSVYSIYNSFRKEETDPTHLSEFHHIEYEGKIGQNENERVCCGLMSSIILDLLKNNADSLAHFLIDSRLDELKTLAFRLKSKKIPKLTFMEALDKLYCATKDEKYKKFTMLHFGSWEEVKLTELMGDMVIVTEFPLLEVPFYHAPVDGKMPAVAENADIIWPGYRETVGSGHRVRSATELLRKAEIFSLPMEDYEPYLQTRCTDDYKETSGFGLGWERMLHGLLEMPFIWSAAQFPRTHNTLRL
jgi:asparaginyl-tRNA synthetase